ncbi:MULTISPECIES: nicotinate-nucleotide adenylyltransferase [Spirulina sp. CCY15215]|uniref:nicotinate-nucleotide adenylyltransferase n=1 Tax=Spirulina sp. CCY15215 TaxID=2767591 RepID=UPI0019522B8F|nr:nicotinate-nucleotide adenylyltransferase [Spirulina major]
MMNSETKNIALFGTSADPPTAGHQMILRWLCDRFDQVAVWASDNPLKSQQTPLKHRLKMLDLAIAQIDAPHHNISLHRELSHRYSVETLKSAQEIWGKNSHFTFVVGSDIIAQLPRWHECEALLRQVQLLIVPRPGYPLREEDLKVVAEMGGRSAIADINAPEVSSSAYRHWHDSRLVMPLVEDYIHQEKLYLP